MARFLGAVLLALGFAFIAGILVNQKAEAPSAEDGVAAGLSGIAAIWSEFLAFLNSIVVAAGPVLGGILIVGIVFGAIWFVFALIGSLFGGIDIDIDM